MAKVPDPDDGLTVEEALKQHTDPVKWRRYEVLRAEHITRRVLVAGKHPDESSEDHHWRFRNAFVERERKARERGRLFTQLEGMLLEKLRSGRLTAYGYTLPRRLDDRRVKIPPARWKDRARLRWSRSRVTFDELEVVDLRIYPSNAAGRIEDTTVIEEGRRPGRPSVMPAILKEHKNRLKRGEAHARVAHEAEALRQWALQKFRDTESEKRVPKPRSIENSVRGQHWQLSRKPHKTRRSKNNLMLI